MKLTMFALLTVATLLISQILLVEGNKQREEKKDKQKGAGKEEKQKSPTRNGEKERRSKGESGSLKGKFISKDSKAECSWSVSGSEAVALNVECTKGETKVSCVYGGNPTACPNYIANQKSYWKQITRALKKQKNICQDHKAVLKSKECKKGPPEAHLRYLLPSVPVPNQEHKVQEQPNPTTKVDIIEPPKDCVEDADVLEKQRLAKEYCGDSWGSLCSFFFSMVQGKSC